MNVGRERERERGRGKLGASVGVLEFSEVFHGECNEMDWRRLRLE